MFAEKGLVKDVSGSCSSEMYVGYKIPEYRRNCSLLDWIFLRITNYMSFSVSHTNNLHIWERTVLNVLLFLDISSDVALSIVTNMGVEFYA